MQASELRMASDAPSMADGPGLGAVKPVTATWGGRYGVVMRMHASVIDTVEFGLIKSIDI